VSELVDIQTGEGV